MPVCILETVQFYLFMQKTAYELRISDWSSDVCSSDLTGFTDTDREFGARGVGAGVDETVADDRDTVERRGVRAVGRPVVARLDRERAGVVDPVAQFVEAARVLEKRVLDGDILVVAELQIDVDAAEHAAEEGGRHLQIAAVHHPDVVKRRVAQLFGVEALDDIAV